jgi:hypothetical protein
MEDEGKRSKFNAGIAQTERIDSLQRAINAARYNPIAMNLETMTFNYDTIIKSIDGLLQECWAKMDDKAGGERDAAEIIRNLVHTYAERFPPVSVSNDASGQQIQKINNTNYKKLMQLIWIYERHVRDLLDAHELNSPSKNEDDDDYDF